MMNPIIGKIQKLLALAENQAGTNEGELAAKFAQRLMMAHAIAMADISAQEARKVDPVEKQTTPTKTGVWRRKLWQHIANHCGCKMSYRSVVGKQTIHLYGHRSDIEVAIYLYKICERQILAATAAYSPKPPYWVDSPAGWMRSKKNNFKRSAVTGLYHKLYCLKGRAAAENPTGFALILGRKQKVETFYATFSFNQGKKTAYDHNAAGYKAGQEVNLASGLGGQRRING